MMWLLAVGDACGMRMQERIQVLGR